MAHGFWQTFTTDQLQLSGSERLITAASCCLAILLTACITRFIAQVEAPILIASMGASAVILFIMPSSPLAQPYPFLAGHWLSAGIGITTIHYLPASLISASAIATGVSVLVMLVCRCLHPPGVATALAPILAHDQLNPLDFSFVLLPVGFNSLILLLLAILLNRILLHRQYPVLNPAISNKSATLEKTDQLSQIHQRDIQQAVANFDSFVDISYTELERLFSQVQLQAYKRQHQSLTCADIMLRDMLTLDYDTDVEVAWAIMQTRGIKVLPVLDRAKHVIGIVTHYDFLKYVKLTPYANFQEKFLAFIHKTPDITTNKPEAIGHIMTRKVSCLEGSSDIANLLPIMTQAGHRYVPIVDAQGHYIGMVFQRDFITALFHNKLRMAGT